MLDVQEFLRNVQDELDRAMAKHGPFHSLHEAYAVLLEEVDELWQHVREKEHVRKYDEVYKELVQCAAMSLKAALYAKGAKHA